MTTIGVRGVVHTMTACVLWFSFSEIPAMFLSSKKCFLQIFSGAPVMLRVTGPHTYMLINGLSFYIHFRNTAHGATLMTTRAGDTTGYYQPHDHSINDSKKVHLSCLGSLPLFLALFLFPLFQRVHVCPEDGVVRLLKPGLVLGSDHGGNFSLACCCTHKAVVGEGGVWFASLAWLQVGCVYCG